MLCLLNVTTYLGHNISKFLLHFLLGTQKLLPQIISHAALLQQRS
jgi:uncharacterized membrane protein YwzB